MATMNRLFPLVPLAALCLTAPASAQIASFQHIILVIQENRTPDNLFQGLCTPTTTNPIPCSTQPGPGQYNIQTTAWLDNTSSNGMTNPKPVQFGLNYDIKHSHPAFTNMCDLNASGACAMDGAAHEACSSQVCPTRAAFGFVDNSKGAVQPYLDLVAAYGWGNYMFQTNQGPSYPAHQFLFGATSAPSAADDANGIFAAENTPSSLAGCAAPITTRVWLINPEGVEFTEIFPCFEHQTVADLLEARAVSWRYYGSSGTAGEWVNSTANGIWMAPNSIKHICVAAGQKCTGSEWTSNVEFSPSAILSDILNCNLRGVSWVTPDSFNSDHMGDVRNTGGPSWVASIVNAVGTSKCKNPDGSSYWSSTAIVITWDDWGGWYDHEPPFIEAFPQGGYQMGFRVPLIVASAYTPAGFISNSPEDFGSVIRFVERNFGIMEGALTFADARGTGDLTEFFSLGNPARRFQAVKAPLSLRHFLTAKPSGLPVDDD
jgi:phospholipase C